MPIRIQEVTGIASPERILRGLHSDCAGSARVFHHRVDLGPGRHVVSDRHVRWRWCGDVKPTIMRDALARPERELQTGLQGKERDGAELQIAANDTLRTETQPVSIKPECSLEVVDADREDAD